MSEILLQILVEKVSAFQKEQQDIKRMIQALPDYSSGLQQTNERIDGIQKEIKGIPARISIPESELAAVRNEIGALRLQLKQPLQQEVRHNHHLSKPVVACFGLAGITLGLVVFLILALDQARDHQAADIKYRFLKLDNSLGTIQSLDYIDSLYQSDPDRMQKGVEKEEQHRKDIFETSQRATEANEDLQKLTKEPKEVKTRSIKQKDR